LDNNIKFIHIIDNKISKNSDFKYNFNNNTETAIIVHVFYIDIWIELQNYLDNITIDFDLHITFADMIEDKDILTIYTHFPNAYYYSVKNQGRDVLPFLNVMKHIGLQQYKYVCKLHTKKTNSSQLGNVWRKLLYFDLIGSDSTVKKAIRLFKKESNVGIISGKNTLLNSIKYDFNNQQNVQNLMQHTNKQFISNYMFPAGTMFWIRPQIISPLIALLQNNQLLFERESAQTDNTLAHAIERIFGLLCKIDNLSIIEIDNSYKTLDNETLHAMASLVLRQQYIDFNLYVKTLMQIEFKDKDIKSLSGKLIYAQDVVQTRDTQLQEVNEKLQTVGEELTHAQKIVKERDSQLQILDNKIKVINKDIEKKNLIIEELIKEKTKFFIQGSISMSSDKKTILREKFSPILLDIDGLHYEKDSLQSLHNNPKIFLDLLNPHQYYKIIIEISAHKNVPINIYYKKDTQREYSKSNCTVGTTNKTNVIYLNTRENIRYFRLDPIDYIGEFTIKYFEIIKISRLEYLYFETPKITTIYQTVKKNPKILKKVFSHIKNGNIDYLLSKTKDKIENNVVLIFKTTL